MTRLQQVCSAIFPIDAAAALAAQKRLDAKTKPRRSLGRLEELACHAAGVLRSPAPPLPAKAVVVMAGDHGVAEEGVSAYPPEVTVQMLHNFAGGGAAINVLARQAGASVVVVDMGTRSRTPIPGVRSHQIGQGTASFIRGPAMKREQALAAVEVGIALADELHGEGVRLVGIGEMGIGNTTAASALTAALLGCPVDAVTGRGTGIDEERRRHKVRVIEQALALHQPSAGDALGALACLGGFEIAGQAGLLLGVVARGMMPVLDGFITGAAALVATALCPRLQPYLLASHRSVEPGHWALLDALRLRPLLELDLRLGEGTGAVLAMPLIEAALRLLHEMATFADAGVSDTGA
jgi:nicotinate-nucleotide--dimethylbenzimidazole phosphoribosyltransferase